MAETGRELTVPHQMSLAGAVSLPVFWLAGAGAAVFWVLGKQNSRDLQFHCIYTLYICSGHQGDYVYVISQYILSHFLLHSTYSKQEGEGKCSKADACLIFYLSPKLRP